MCVCACVGELFAVDFVIAVRNCSLQFTLINCISNVLALQLPAVGVGRSTGRGAETETELWASVPLCGLRVGRSLEVSGFAVEPQSANKQIH